MNIATTKKIYIQKDIYLNDEIIPVVFVSNFKNKICYTEGHLFKFNISFQIKNKVKYKKRDTLDHNIDKLLKYYIVPSIEFFERIDCAKRGDIYVKKVIDVD